MFTVCGKEDVANIVILKKFIGTFHHAFGIVTRIVESTRMDRHPSLFVEFLLNESLCSSDKARVRSENYARYLIKRFGKVMAHTPASWA